jgi:hypothetical protein
MRRLFVVLGLVALCGCATGRSGAACTALDFLDS